MIFLTKADFYGQIKDHTLQRIINSDDTYLDQLELASIEEMQSYLLLKYDCAVIFSQIGADRHPLLVMYLVDILLYHLYSRLDPSQIPDIRILRYEQAIAWLQKIAKGLIAVDLPLLDDPNGNGGVYRFNFGSEPRRPQ